MKADALLNALIKNQAELDRTNYTNSLFTDLFSYRYRIPTLDFDNYIIEVQDAILDLLKDEKNYNFIAPMNSGKTFSLIQLALENNLKIIFAVPLTTLSGQIYEAFKASGHQIIFIHGQSPNNHPSIATPQDLLHKWIGEDMINVIVCVYDSLDKLENLFEQNNLYKDYILVIDEAHYLIAAANYRFKAINYLQKISSKFKKTICLTGTPEFVLKNDFTNIKFEKKEKKENHTKIQIVILKENQLFRLLQHTLKIKGEGRIIIVRDNIADLKDIQNGLMILGVAKEKILLLSRETKSEEGFQNILRYAEIPSGVEFVLSTRVISDGISINDENIDAVYFWGVEDFWMKRQFVARFRKGVDNVFEFINPEFYTKYKFNQLEYKNVFHEILVDATNINDLSKKVVFKRNFKENFDIKSQRNQGLFFNELLQEFQTTDELVYNMIFRRINSTFMSNPNMAIDFYEEVAGINCEVISYDQVAKEMNIMESKREIKSFKATLKRINQEIDVEDPSSLDRFFFTIMSDWLIRSKKKRFEMHEYSQKEFLDLATPSDFHKTNKAIFQKDSLDKTLNRALLLAKRGFPKNVIKGVAAFQLIKPGLHNELEMYLLQLYLHSISTAFELIGNLSAYINAIQPRIPVINFIGGLRKQFSIRNTYKKSEAEKLILASLRESGYYLKLTQLNIIPIIESIFETVDKPIRRKRNQKDEKIMQIYLPKCASKEIVINHSPNLKHFCNVSELLPCWEHITYATLFDELTNAERNLGKDKEPNAAFFELKSLLSLRLELLKIPIP